MRILIDGSTLVNRVTGIGTYTIDVIRAIAKYQPEWELILALPGDIHASVEGLPLDHLKIAKAPLPFIRMRLPWVVLKLPSLVKKYKPDLLWSPNKMLPVTDLGKCKTLTTIHDVVWKEFTETARSNTYSKIFNWVVDKSLRKADYIWYNSEYTKRSTEKYYPELATKPQLIGDSCNTRFKKIAVTAEQAEEIKREYSITKGFILFVGSLEPRKNLSFLIKLMPEIYKNTGYQLLIVGARGWKNNDIKEIVMNPDFNKHSVIFADYISNDKLVLLYNTARCYVSTALNEGFGMPQLEAMACGCPVISPNNSAMTEVVSGRGILVDGWDEEVWIDTICNTISYEQILNGLKQPNIDDYSWEHIIKKLATCIK